MFLLLTRCKSWGWKWFNEYEDDTHDVGEMDELKEKINT